MNVTECIKARRSIRRYKPEPVDHSLIDSIVSMASYSPSWKSDHPLHRDRRFFTSKRDRRQVYP